MKVIVASFAKCGTKTLHKCLDTLGYRVMDFDTSALEFAGEWVKIFNYGSTRQQFQKMFEGYDAVCDLPGCYYWEEILDAFPDAKVILTMRSSEKVWLKSWRNQISSVEASTGFFFMRLLSPTARKFASYYATMGRVVLGAPKQSIFTWLTHPNGQLQMRRYREHNDAVLHRAPKDRLLVLEFPSGWKPLCEFLGKDVPDVPFPHENIGAESVDMIWMDMPLFSQIRKELYIVTFFIVVAAAFLLYYLGVM